LQARADEFEAEIHLVFQRDHYGGGMFSRVADNGDDDHADEDLREAERLQAASTDP
jgi:hypothetical protein